MGNNRSELMRVDYLSSLPSTPPLVMVITGVEKGTSLCALLSALWQDSHYSPDLFKHIGGIFLDRSALYSANPGYFVEKALRAYGHSDSLNLVLSSDVDPQHICRPTIGQAISSLLGLDAQGIRLVPDHTRVPPSSLSMFSRLLALHRSLRPKVTVSANRGLTSTPPSNPRMPRGPPSSSQKLKALTCGCGSSWTLLQPDGSHPSRSVLSSTVPPNVSWQSSPALREDGLDPDAPTGDGMADEYKDEFNDYYQHEF
eukprot:gene2023-2404_t